jgi:hypothetical protein
LNPPGIKLKMGDAEFGLEIDLETGSADSGDLEADLAELFVAVGEAAADRGTAVAIIVDELQYMTEVEMSALIMAIHRVSQRNLPLVLIGAGLPQLVGLAGKSKFMRRDCLFIQSWARCRCKTLH